MDVDDQIDFLGLYPFDGLQAILSDYHRITLALDHVGKGLTHIGFVVDDQDPKVFHQEIPHAYSYQRPLAVIPSNCL